jgi:hypothetical protein
MDKDEFFMTHDAYFNSQHHEFVQNEHREKGSLFALLKVSEIKDKFTILDQFSSPTTAQYLEAAKNLKVVRNIGKHVT